MGECISAACEDGPKYITSGLDLLSFAADLIGFYNDAKPYLEVPARDKIIWNIFDNAGVTPCSSDLETFTNAMAWMDAFVQEHSDYYADVYECGLSAYEVGQLVAAGKQHVAYEKLKKRFYQQCVDEAFIQLYGTQAFRLTDPDDRINWKDVRNTANEMFDAIFNNFCAKCTQLYDETNELVRRVFNSLPVLY